MHGKIHLSFKIVTIIKKILSILKYQSFYKISDMSYCV